ncbi:MAG: type VII toxin-antitoxin system MntA family adenylyltransferase antitoxin [Candidatus Poribacteria bacterium]
MIINEITEKLNKYFEEHEEILFAVIFGSMAKGSMNKMSDIDIAVMINPSFNKSFPFGHQAELITDFIRILKRNDVDVVILNKAPISLKYEILRYGKFIYVRDKQARIKFQVDTINQYEDYKMLYKIHEEAMRKRWKKLASETVEGELK